MEWGFDEFLDAHYEAVRRALAVALNDADRAEDLAQEAFARAYQRWSVVAAMERPVAWVYVVAVNQARRDIRRSQQRFRPTTRSYTPDVSSTVVAAVSLREALATLAPRQRAVVVLRYLADLSTAEVADALGCAQGTVKSTLHQALGHLRVELEEVDP